MDVKDSFVDLERHRLRLEENLAKLRQSLQHWQTWEAEYEGLKEEILALGEGPSSEELIAIGRDFGGTLVNEKEIKTLLGDGNKVERTSTQVIDLISRRLDYVQRNVRTVETQVAAAEEKLSALLVIRQPEVRDEDGLPLTEIREELDDDGNVISSTTTKPGDAAPQVVEVLRKAGAIDLPSSSAARQEPEEPVKIPETSLATPASPLSPEMVSEQTVEAAERDELNGSYASQVRETGTEAENGHTNIPRTSLGKSVKFADAVSDNSSSAADTEASLNGQATSTSTATSITAADLAHDFEDDGAADSDRPIIPDEPPEDAALRRQMLQYGLEEVGAVVAELDLDEESGSQFSYSDDDINGDEQYSSSEEEEDAFGRTTRRVIDDDYRREMLELEKKLMAKSMEKPEPNSQREARVVEEAVVEQAIGKPITSISATKPRKSAIKKGVRFAEELDISPSPGDGPTVKSTIMANGESPSTIKDFIVERAVPQMAPPSTGSVTPKKVSRFKMAREGAQYRGMTSATGNSSSQPPIGPLDGPILQKLAPGDVSPSPPIPATSSKRKDLNGPIDIVAAKQIKQVLEGPAGKTHVDTIVERDVSQTVAKPPDPDDVDPVLLQQEVAVEYHRMRNRMIQREGGFMPREEEEERVPLTEEEGGSGQKKMSRFMAARLRGHT